VTLLGPSGSGKTTLLNVVAGFVQPDDGDVMLAGEDVTDVPPHKRSLNTVFQGYALFPHLNVERNVAFGLKMKGVAKEEQRRRVAEALEMVEMTTMIDRPVDRLSGGQQQRVALARAIVNRPQLVLLDEPLSALDAKLRKSMQIELKRIQRESGITFVYVTHDQEEALAMSDMICLLNEGRIEQSGTPSELYSEPANRFAASFIGRNNLIEGELVRNGNGPEARHFVVAGHQIAVPPGEELGAAVLAVRPEDVSVADAPGPYTLRSTVVGTRFLGDRIEAEAEIASGGPVVSLYAEGPEAIAAAEIHLSFAADRCRLLPAE